MGRCRPETTRRRTCPQRRTRRTGEVWSPSGPANAVPGEFDDGESTPVDRVDVPDSDGTHDTGDTIAKQPDRDGTQDHGGRAQVQVIEEVLRREHGDTRGTLEADVAVIAQTACSFRFQGPELKKEMTEIHRGGLPWPPRALHRASYLSPRGRKAAHALPRK